MIKNKFLDYLMESPLVYYIYNRGSIIYNLGQSNSDIDFLVICDKEFQVSEEFKEYQNKNENVYSPSSWHNVVYDNCDFTFKDKESGFDSILDCDIEAWECACLPKKFIYKEYVKLLLNVDPLKLREQCDVILELFTRVATNNFQRGNYYEGKKLLWRIIKDYAFSNQIIENHKIINFKELNDTYNKLVLNDSIDIDSLLKYGVELLEPHKKKLETLTNGILKNSKLKKIIQNDK